MNEEHLREELLQLLRKRYEPVWEIQSERQKRLDALSDEEWWDQYSASLADSPLAARLYELKGEVVKHRFDQSNFVRDGGNTRILESEADRLMPFILEVREEFGAQGPLTEEQFHQASLRSSKASIHEMTGQFKELTNRATDPRKREFLKQFTENIEADAEDMKVFDDPSITDDQIQEVTAKMLKRMTRLTDSMRKPPEETD